MRVFDIVNNKVVLNPDVLNIPVFKIIYDRDKSKEKNQAFRDLSYIYHMADNNSIYADFPQNKREEMIKIDFKIEEDYSKDVEIQSAIVKYREYAESPKQRLLRAAKNKIGEFGEFMDTTSLTVDTVDSIQKIFKDLSNTIANFDKLEEAVKKEKESNTSKVRGNKSISMFEQ